MTPATSEKELSEKMNFKNEQLNIRHLCPELQFTHWVGSEQAPPVIGISRFFRQLLLIFWFTTCAAVQLKTFALKNISNSPNHH